MSKRYKLIPGRVIVRASDDLPIAIISGISLTGEFAKTPYSIGLPSKLDDFARKIVRALNRG
jgi:hypothetical protein